MAIISEDKINGSSTSLELKKVKQQLEELQQSEKNDEMVAFKKIINPLKDAILDLNETIKEINDAEVAEAKKEKSTPEYFDKEQNVKLITSIDKVFNLLKGFKQQEIKIDVSPIANEIKNQNSAIINLVTSLSKQNNQQGYESLLRETMAMINKSNDAINQLKQQADYSEILQKINSTIENNRPVEWEFKSTRATYGGELTTKAKPIFKK